MSAPTTKGLSKTKLKVIRGEMTAAHDNFENTLLRHALYKTSNLAVSQDLVQTTFLKTLVYLRKGGKVDLMRSFLNHVLNALIIDEYRKNGKNKTLSLDALLDKGFDPGSGLNEYERTTDILDGKEIILLLPQLSEKYERVIELRYLKGLSLKEISLLTGQSENTVAVQVHRGLQKLKKLYFDT